MKTHVVYGAYCAIAGACLQLALYFTGLQTERLAQGQHFQWLGLLIFGTILFFGMKEVRESKPHQELAYSGAFVAGLLISIFAGLFGALYTFVHFTWVNPDYPQYLEDLVRTQLQAKGVPSANIDAAVKLQTVFLRPWVQAVASVIVTPIMGILCSLLLAIFAKRTPQEHPEEPKAV